MKDRSSDSIQSSSAGRFTDLLPAKRALVRQKLAETRAGSFVKQTIPRRSMAESAPLSFAQQRLWFLDQYQPDSSIYNVASALRLQGRLDVAALQRSLNEIVRRHEALRTTFASAAGEPVQIIAPSLDLALPVIDATAIAAGEREEKALRSAANEAQRPFDLRHGPLFRSALIRLDERDHLLVLSMHHIISDGWSTGILHRELSALYQAFSRSQPSPLLELPIQYADYALWQRQWLNGHELERQLSYWKRQLAGAPALIALPTDHPRPALQSYRGARQSLELSKDLTRSLKALSQREGVTLFMTLLAAFQTLLHRYTGQVDIVVGSPIANRNRTEIERLIGFFVNTLVLRADLSGTPTFRELLQRVRKTALEAYEHQDLPFEKLVEELKPQRHLSHSPLFQVMFVLQNTPTAALEFDGLTATSVSLENDTAKFDLALAMREEQGGLNASLRYCKDLFDDRTMARMLEHFQRLLEDVVTNPQQRLFELQCLTAAEERALHDRRSRQGAPAPAAFDNRELATNLTPLQFQFWVGQKLNSTMALYNMVGLFDIAATIDPERFSSAFATVVEQSDALRTIIEERGGVPQSKVLAALPYSMDLIDLSAQPNPPAALEQWAEERGSRLFEFDKGMFDTALVKLADDRFVWYLNIHHIVADGWSFAVIFQRVQRLYRGASERRFAPPAPPPFQNYVDEERAYRRSPEYRADQAYWDAKLARPAQPLCFYGQPAAARAVAVRRVTFALGDQRVEKIKTLALRPDFAGKTLNVSLFNIFAAIFAAYLHRISGNDEISIGTPYLNRSETYRDTVGLFMQVAPLRLGVSGSESFTALVHKMQAESWQTQQHRRYTLRNHEKRLYDAIFNFHNVAFPCFDGAPVQETWLHSGNDTTSLSLHLRNPQDDSLALQFDFHPDVFPAEQAEPAIQHFRALLDGFLADPDQPIGKVDLLSQEEKRRLLVEFNNLRTCPHPSPPPEVSVSQSNVRPSILRGASGQAPSTAFSPELVEGSERAVKSLNLGSHDPLMLSLSKHETESRHSLERAGIEEHSLIQQLFEKQAAQTPEATAVVSHAPDLDPAQRQQLTYGELNASANRLAHYLAKRGVGPGVLVGVCLERCLEALVSIMAVLKAGGAYLPLDPDYPAERLRFMLEDSQVTLVVSKKRWTGLLGVYRAEVICLDCDEGQWSRESSENPICRQTGDAPAYVIYTSGSTGRSKGVVIAQRSLMAAYLAWEAGYQLKSLRAHLQMANFSFDVFSGDWVRALCAGARLIICPAQILLEPARLYALMRQEEVDWGEFVPAVLRELLNYLSHSGQRLEFMRGLVCGSDTWHVDDYLRALRFCGPTTRLINSYGITEATIDSSFFEGAIPSRLPSNWVPIGRPFAQTQLYILDAHLCPAPVGVAGELYVGGRGVAQGYLNRPELTAEKFIPNPFGAPGSRLYKTGDMARYLPDGNIEFLGRGDRQVKIRGFRVETGEIEAALAQHPAVKESVVVAREVGPGERRLVAYVVKTAPAVPGQELRSFLRGKLPGYMVPESFVLLDALPLTPNGKLDHNALPAPERSRLDLEEEFAAPQSVVEEMLAGIWTEVLKVEKVGLHDNFFDLGGHSLLATQVISRANRAFRTELPLCALFESPTVGGLAQRIEAMRRDQQGQADLPILPVPRQNELPLSFAQERLWFLDQLEPGSTVYNMSGTFRLSGRLDVAALERSLNEIVRRHEALRTTFSSVEGAPRQVVAAEMIVALPVIDLSNGPASARDEEARQYAAEAARRPFDLSRGPLLRATLVRLGEEEHILLLGMHHIVSDGWSIAILFRELAALYEAYANGKASPLPDLPIQYADYAVWQRNWLRGEILEKQISYWGKQLENISPLNLATDRPRPPVQTIRGARDSLLLSKDLTQALKALSRKQGVSLFMTLLAALQVLLHRLTGQDDIAVGSPIAGRNRAELESLIGFFLNTLVLRTKFLGDPTFLQLLDQVRGVCLEAYAHQDVPFEKLLEELRPERDLSRTPFFQVFLNMVNVPERVPPAGLKIEALSHAEVESKFDLTIYVKEHEGALQLRWVYNADLFDRERIQEMLSQYGKLLSEISAQPAKTVHSYSLLTAAAQERLPNPVAPLARDWAGAVHHKFSQHAKSLPDQLAISAPNGSWTYAELNARANQLAHYLKTGGIQREEIIAIYAHRSAAFPWALLGILKAGAAFLILDPAYPTARLIQYVRAARPRGLISLQAAGAMPTDLQRVLDETVQCRAALPDNLEQRSFLDSYSAADPGIDIRPDDLAYISYTSGSTGEPKGVQGAHGPLSHFLPWQAAHFGLTSADRFSLLSGLAHDPLHREILTAFWMGATLCIPGPDLLGAGSALPAWLAQQRVTFAHLTPALGRLLLDSAKPENRLPSLRYAFFVGDKLMRRDIARLRCLAPQVSAVNYYGSTETQRAVSYYEIPAQVEYQTGESVVPVGRGMPGAQLLVLTRAQGLAGIGEVGEIYMRSPHLAKGYMGDPALTRARFVTNPFTLEARDRIYRTGDLGRYLRDGSVEVLGRTDGQVNIRGFRVEPGEIEFALGQHPALRDAVVVAREELKGNKRLIAYLVAAQEPVPAIQGLRSFLKQRLPEHMIPSAFVFLKSLPLTPNGKLDHRALPAPEYTRHDQGAEFAAPRNGLELQLAQIWEKLLRIRPIGIRDNFFDLGGHSLLAVRLFAQIEKATGKHLPVAALFHAPTVEQLAGLISRDGWSAQWKSLVAIQPGGSKPPLFCLHAHDGGVLFWRDLAQHLGPDQPFYALQPQGLDGRRPPHSRIEEMAAHYIKEMRSLQPEGPYFIAGHCIGGLMAFEMAQQLHSQGETVALLALIDSFAPRREGSVRSSLARRFCRRAIRLYERTVALHISNLAFLESGERLSYITAKINKALYKFYMAAGAAWLPAARNRRKILKAGSAAARLYSAKSYPGKIILFRATELGRGIKHDFEMGWSRWAGGELETHLIPGYHAHIVLEPRVRLLAQELLGCLRKAQAESRREPRRKERCATAQGSLGFRVSGLGLESAPEALDARHETP